jgi:hypothetical protein
MNNRKQSVLVALQQALLGEVSERLRAVTVSYDETSLHFEAIFDGKVGDDDRESMSYVETELIALFPSAHVITHAVQQSDFPAPIPKDKAWAFYRKE